MQLEIGSLEALCVQYIESSICQENVLVALDSAARLQLDPLKVWKTYLIVINLKDHGLKSHEPQSASLVNNPVKLESYLTSSLVVAHTVFLINFALENSFFFFFWRIMRGAVESRLMRWTPDGIIRVAQNLVHRSGNPGLARILISYLQRFGEVLCLFCLSRSFEFEWSQATLHISTEKRFYTRKINT